jgi:small subunit ribosomal protein S20
MANKSALKRIKTGEKARIRHKARTTAMNTSEKKLRSAVADSEQESAATILTETISKLDKAVKAGTIHKNKANRKKSKLTQLVKGIKK